MSGPKCPECGAKGMPTDDPAVWTCRSAPQYMFTVSLDKADMQTRVKIVEDRMVSEQVYQVYKVISQGGDHGQA